ncbi:hypothetical protein [Clostridium sp. CCUG 7971]|uniref:hypothetical protein n=1 Tax=Clostridium sp. CCUG 7971 TaxID=2811414 RepID=UPI001ABBDD38|nr:hypothetical protein [Clostridium sp. CCUG 7971]MBO3445607.1 hypothetical protein [Clostridium sp. CCUG 7971]
MTSDEFNNVYLINEENNFNSSTSDYYNNFKNFAKNNPALTTGLATASVIATASVVSPKVRKVTMPVCKYVVKQQLKLLTGIGLLSVARSISNQSNLYNKLDDNNL